MKKLTLLTVLLVNMTAYAAQIREGSVAINFQVWKYVSFYQPTLDEYRLFLQDESAPLPSGIVNFEQNIPRSVAQDKARYTRKLSVEYLEEQQDDINSRERSVIEYGSDEYFQSMQTFDVFFKKPIKLLAAHWTGSTWDNDGTWITHPAGRYTMNCEVRGANIYPLSHNACWNNDDTTTMFAIVNGDAYVVSSNPAPAPAPFKGGGGGGGGSNPGPSASAVPYTISFSPTITIEGSTATISGNTFGGGTSTTTDDQGGQSLRPPYNEEANSYVLYDNGQFALGGMWNGSEFQPNYNQCYQYNGQGGWNQGQCSAGFFLGLSCDGGYRGGAWCGGSRWNNCQRTSYCSNNFNTHYNNCHVTTNTYVNNNHTVNPNPNHGGGFVPNGSGTGGFTPNGSGPVANSGGFVSNGSGQVAKSNSGSSNGGFNGNSSGFAARGNSSNGSTFNGSGNTNHSQASMNRSGMNQSTGHITGTMNTSHNRQFASAQQSQRYGQQAQRNGSQQSQHYGQQSQSRGYSPAASYRGGNSYRGGTSHYSGGGHSGGGGHGGGGRGR